jgi:phosphoribosylformylglycinamidine cyclo-ligase
MSMTTPKKPSFSYKQAGVDIEQGENLVHKITHSARATTRPGVMSSLGGFGALFDLTKTKYVDPILVSSTDGVGTKLLLAAEHDKHHSIGIDLVAMCANDIVVQGAEPLFFLDYFATGKLDVRVAEKVIAGIAEGCKQAGAALIGGETAEMPGMYSAKHYDLAGFCVGAVERNKVIDGKSVQPGDLIIGIDSAGIHSNGYSLVRKILEEKNVRTTLKLGSRTISDLLLAPTTIYVKPLLDLMQDCPIRALAHITGGGLTQNLPRILPPGTMAELHLSKWETPEIFQWLQKTSGISDSEMLQTFNCGIGMAVVIEDKYKTKVIEKLNEWDLNSQEIGIVRKGMPSVVYNGNLST